MQLTVERLVERPDGPNSSKEEQLALIERLVGQRPNPAYVSHRGTDLCVICGADTGVPVTLDVSARSHYVEGVGQCCATCAGR